MDIKQLNEELDKVLGKTFEISSIEHDYHDIVNESDFKDFFEDEFESYLYRNDFENVDEIEDEKIRKIYKNILKRKEQNLAISIDEMEKFLTLYDYKITEH